MSRIKEFIVDKPWAVFWPTVALAVGLSFLHSTQAGLMALTIFGILFGLLYLVSIVGLIYILGSAAAGWPQFRE